MDITNQALLRKHEEGYVGEGCYELLGMADVIILCSGTEPRTSECILFDSFFAKTLLFEGAEQNEQKGRHKDNQHQNIQTCLKHVRARRSRSVLISLID